MLNSKAFDDFRPQTRGKAQAIFDVLAMQDDNDLSGALQRQWLRSYRQAYNGLLKNAGTRIRLYIIPAEVRDKIATNARQDAERIRYTFNRDLQAQIEALVRENPNMNKRDMVARLRAWHLERDSWKSRQIALWTDRSAVNQAQQDFILQNREALRNVRARISPTTAVCSGCQRLIDMGEVPVEVARQNPCPVHANCVHEWVYTFQVEGRLPILENLIVRYRG